MFRGPRGALRGGGLRWRGGLLGRILKFFLNLGSSRCALNPGAALLRGLWPLGWPRDVPASGPPTACQLQAEQGRLDFQKSHRPRAGEAWGEGPGASMVQREPQERRGQRASWAYCSLNPKVRAGNDARDQPDTDGRTGRARCPRSLSLLARSKPYRVSPYFQFSRSVGSDS